jgi:hypothetical protein
MRPQQPFEKACCSKSISPGLQKNINHLTILINGPPKIALLAVYLHEDFVDVEGVTESSVPLLQSTCVFGSELDAPEADRFPSDYDPTLSQEIFDIPVAQVEAIVEPDSVGNDTRRESVAFVGIHRPILLMPRSERPRPL